MVARYDDIRLSKGWAPFRLVVLAELEPRNSFALRCPGPRRMATLTLNTFDKLLGSVEPAFRLQLLDRLTNKEVDVDVRWRQWTDVGGNGLVASPAVAAMRDAHTSLTRGTTRTDPYVFVERVLPGHRARPSGEATSHVPASPPGRPAPGDALGRLFEAVDLPSSQDDGKESTQFAAAASAVEQNLSELLCDVLAHPEYRRLRRVWQSLRALSQCLGDSRLVELMVVSSLPETGDLEEALANVSADLVIHEAPFEACARDADCMNWLADWGAEHNTPVITSLDDSWIATPGTATSRPELRLAHAAKLWVDGIGRREQARWLTIAVNDRCDGEPLAGSIVRGGPVCMQPRDARSSWSFSSAGTILGELLVRSLVSNGEPFMADDVAPACRSQAMHEIPTSAGTVAVGTRWFCTETAATDLAQVGICALVPTLNRDGIRVLAVPTAHRARNAAGDLHPPATTLGDQILAGRIAHLLERLQPLWRDEMDPSAMVAVLEQTLASLFPKAPPVGPLIEVTVIRGDLTVSIRPRRYGQLRSEQLSWTIRSH